MRALSLLALAAVAAAALPRLAWSTTYTPTPDEYALLALANDARASSGLRPYIWHQGLGEGARVHSDDMADNGCYRHDSCNGESWSTRISRYYSPWTTLGENVGGSDTPRDIHNSWMASPGHRANILGSFTEFGAGIAVSDLLLTYATEDFASRGTISASLYPTIPAAAVTPRVGYAEDTRELLVNYFDLGGAPQTVRALVGSSCVTLSRISGSVTNGTWGTTLTFPSAGCVPVVFEAIRANGVRVRWPASQAINVGTGTASLSCLEWTSAVPTQDCGGPLPPPPTPSPAPTPTPGATATPTPVAEVDDGLDATRVVLKPSVRDPSTGVVQLQATLPFVPGLDPSSAPVTMEVDYGHGGQWTLSIPQTCGETSCLKGNSRRMSYRSAASKVTLSFTLDRSGRWKVSFAGRSEHLGSTVTAGLVDVRITAGDRTFTSSVGGTLRKLTLTAK